MKKALLTLAILAVTAFGGSVPNGGNFRIKLLQPSVVKGNELKPGEYRINVASDKMTIRNGKQNIEVDVKVENSAEKFVSDAIRYTMDNGKAVVSEIRIGGTTTKLVLN